MSTRVLVLSEPDVVDFYRGRGPLQQDFAVVEVMRPDELHWADVRGADVVYMPRPSAQEHLEILAEVARWGKRTWIDYDDLLTAVPFSNPAWAKFRDCGPLVEKALAAADIVTCSTGRLAELYGGKVVHNAAMFPVQPLKARESKSVAWRGGESHSEDVFEFMNALPNGIEVESHGFLPWYWVRAGHAVQHSPMVVTSRFFRKLVDAKSHVLVVPLADHEFNRCKSNIAALEAWSAGMIPVVPHWPEWEGTSPFTYTNPASFKAAVTAALKANPAEYDSYRAKVLERYSLASANSLRKEILCGRK